MLGSNCNTKQTESLCWSFGSRNGQLGGPVCCLFFSIRTWPTLLIHGQASDLTLEPVDDLTPFRTPRALQAAAQFYVEKISCLARAADRIGAF